MSLLTLVRGDGEKPFDASAIEDHGGTKMKTNGTDSDRILRSLLHKGVIGGHTPRGSLFLRERRLNVREQYKYMICNICIICLCVYLGCTTANYEIPLMTRAYRPVGHVLSVS